MLTFFLRVANFVGVGYSFWQDYGEFMHMLFVVSRFGTWEFLDLPLSFRTLYVVTSSSPNIYKLIILIGVKWNSMSQKIYSFRFKVIIRQGQI